MRNRWRFIAWLQGGHYKWRAMPTLGVPEHYITGEASDSEKLQKWAGTAPFALSNPLFHWTHLELQRYFGITDLLSPKTAADIYEQCTDMLQTPEYSTRNLLCKMNVEAVCSTDDPMDNLEHHRQAQTDGLEITLRPAFRPDQAILIEKEAFSGYLQKLGKAAGAKITDFVTYFPELSLWLPRAFGF